MRSQSASDSATASGNSVALVALVSLEQRAKSFALQSQIDQQILRFSSRLNSSPLALTYMLTGIDEYLHPKPHSMQYAGGGHVRVTATLQQSESKANQLSVELVIENGWHINANNIGIAKLIATELTLDNGRAKAISYPKGIEKTVTFTDSPLALYQGRVKIVAELQKGTDHLTVAPIVATIRLQTCSDSVCLPPETLRMVLRN